MGSFGSCGILCRIPDGFSFFVATRVGDGSFGVSGIGTYPDDAINDLLNQENEIRSILNA